MGIEGFIGRIGKTIDHEIDKIVKIISETRKGYNQKTAHYNPSGEDSPPVKGDQLVMVKIDGTGKYVVVGILNESQGANPGEKIFYSRDQKGNIVLKIKMLNNGDYIFDNISETTGEATGNASGKIKNNLTLKVGGDFILEVAGNIKVTAAKNISFDAARIDLC